MEKRLCEAAMSEVRAASLPEIQEEEREKLVMSYLNASPLHLAALRGNLEFVKKVVHQIPELAEAVDSRRRTPLHLASAKGHIDIVKELVSANIGMCTSRDDDGRNPLHVAVVEGKVDILEVLFQACPHAALAKLEGNETILHLCVKHNQVQALELMLRNCKLEKLVNALDADGNTILHLAVADANFEIATVLNDFKVNIDVNTKNMNGYTPLDMLQKGVGNNSATTADRLRIMSFFPRSAKTAHTIQREEWMDKKKDSFMVVATLIAAVAFQAAVSPPGGVWQDNSGGHKAGQAVMAYNYPDTYSRFLRANTIAFLGSVVTILLLISKLPMKRYVHVLTLFTTLMVAAVALAYAYIFTISAMTPLELEQQVSQPLATLIVIFTVSPAFSMYVADAFDDAKDIWQRYKARNRMIRSAYTLPPQGTV